MTTLADYRDLVKAAIDIEIDQRRDVLSAGMADSMEGYRAMTGAIRGLRIAQEKLDEIYKRLVAPEEPKEAENAEEKWA